MMILIDGDEIAFKSSVSRTTWQAGMNFYPTKTKAIEAGEDPSTLTKNAVSPFKKSVLNQMDSMIRKIEARVAQEFSTETEFKTIVVLSGSGNYRKIAYPDYKSNRVGREVPFYLEMAKKYLAGKYDSVITQDEEGDDKLGQLSVFHKDAVIASSDKDMRTIPGWIYNIMHDKFEHITEEASWKNLYIQMLVGDVADGVAGAPGIGPVKAAKAINTCTSPKEALQSVIVIYVNKGLTLADVQKAGFLLYIRQHPVEMWDMERILNEED